MHQSRCSVRFVHIAAAMLCCLIGVSAAPAATYLVATHLDSGPGTLRQAVLDANANPGADTIMFDERYFDGTPTIGFSEEMQITDSLTIEGPPNRVVISGNLLTRIFRVDDESDTSIAVTFTKLRLFNGEALGEERGGAVLLSNENLTCIDCEFNSNTSQDAGGAINCLGGASSSLTLKRCAFTLNEAATAGGAIAAYGNVILTINDCTFWDNRAFAGGAINQNSGGQIVVQGSSFFENIAQSSAAGAIFLNSNFAQAVIRNSTLSHNTAATDGGAIALGTFFASNLTLQNCTIAHNTSAGGSGGAIARMDGTTTAAINVNSCILWGNTALNPSPALFTSGTVNADACLLQSASGVNTFNGDAFTQSHLGINPLISPLANNGGLTLTHLLQFGSPAIDNGQNPAGLTFDQRGDVFPRSIDGDCDGEALPDIGALEVHICHCPGDANEDGIVNVNDLLLIINHWGYNGAAGGILADVNNSGQVNVNDLLAVINGWGVCP